jgi:hypothetical protein
MFTGRLRGAGQAVIKNKVGIKELGKGDREVELKVVGNYIL